MIEVEKLDDGYRYWSQTSDVIAHNQSGHMNSYSPDGNWLGLLEGTLWHLVGLGGEILPMDIDPIHRRAWAGASNNVLQWTPNSELLRIEGNVVDIWNILRGLHRRIELPKVDPPNNWDWMNWRSGDSTNQKLLHVWHGAGSNTDGSIGYFTLCIIDTETAQIVNLYPFDEKVHLGSSTQPRWHHCFGCGDHLMVSLSGWGPAGNPHYSCQKSDGTFWTQLSNHGSQRQPLQPRTLPWSHVAYHPKNAFVLYGYDNRIQVTHWPSGRLSHELVIPRERKAGYGHGCFVDDMVTYSIHDWTRGVDTEVWVWDLGLDKHTKIADLSGLTRRDTSSRARPQLAWDGSEVGWHELRDVKGFVSFRTKRIEKPKPEPSDLRLQYERTAAEFARLGAMIP